MSGHIFFSNQTIVQKRLPEDLGNLFGVELTLYDKDNKYPQRLKELALRSPLTKSAISVLADFINGEGFEISGDLIMNRDGQTADDLLNLTSHDESTYNGWALLLNFNGLGDLIEAQYLPFEFVRYGWPDALGRHDHVFVSQNWEQDPLKTLDKTLVEPVRFELFNPLTAGLNANGTVNAQVLYVTQRPDEYPLTTFDAIADATQADADIQLFELTNVAKGFHGLTVFKYPGEFESEEEKLHIKHKVENMTGPRSPGVMLATVEEDFTGDLLETVSGTNVDKIFEFTKGDIRDTIVQNYAVPPPLMGIFPDGGVFNQAALRDSHIYYNWRTSNRRNRMARTFNVLGALWEVPTSFGEIEIENFMDSLVPMQQAAMGIEPETTETEETEETATEARMIKLYGS